MSSAGVGGTEPVSSDSKAPSTSADDEVPQPSSGEGPTEDAPKQDSGASSPPPQSQPSQQTGYHQQMTPQQGYYSGYVQSQMTPEPPSPAAPGGTGAYDVASFLQQQAAMAQQSGLTSNPFGGNVHYSIPQPPLSPSGSARTMGIIPPASPLFPRAATNSAGLPTGSLDPQHQLDSSLPRMAAPPSPSVYLSPPLGPSSGSTYSGMYGYGVGYGNATEGGAKSNNSPEESTAKWGERTSPPQHAGAPYAASRATAGNRAYSFEEMLPPSVLDQQEQQSPITYSPYGATQTTSSVFAHQPWTYSPTTDIYAVPGSPLQPRPNPASHLPGQYGGGMRPMYPAQQPGMPPYYPASSPGPPIQTTASNKGPEGANLFIFHIPNHFTNLDMYHLFCQYGNLLSVRIMVEKDTGRSRGFGFVSYDSPESAAMAIKELNGFSIGNKRLKVQHKQVRASDRQQNDHTAHSGALPPTSRWYDAGTAPPQPVPPPDTSEAPVEEGGAQGLGSVDETQANPSLVGPKETGVDLPHTPGSGGVDLQLASGTAPALSPLGNLDQMRNALPDVSE